MAEAPTEPTYHIHIWDTPPTFVCQVCNQQQMTKPEVITHLDTEHQLPPMPTLLAADYERGEPTLREMLMPPTPTYYTTQEDSTTVYNCLLCHGEGREHHATDRELFEQHQHQRHAGEMIEGTEPVQEEGGARQTGTEEEPGPGEEALAPPAPEPPPEPAEPEAREG